MTDRLVIRRGTFLDSVALMTASRDAAGMEGIVAASIVNATPLNVELLERQGFSLAAEPDGVGSNDLVIALRGDPAASLDRALEEIERRLRHGRPAEPGSGERRPPRSVSAAARRAPDSSLALISVPGQHSAYECARALDAGLDVFCFSSGPSLEAEAVLKRRALERGLMMMGPDCGTAILNGVSLGFGNAVEPGPVGIVGASGTGIQAICCLLDQAGVGISQAIGVGGRDLRAEIGGPMALRAIELLGADPDTEAIVVVSKAPDPEVAARVARAAEATGKHAVLAFPGLRGGRDAPLGELAASLEDAASRAALSIGAELPAPTRWGSVRPASGAIRGLFSGGTLRDEASAIVGAALGEVGTELESEGHALVDLGDERFTEGRAHPMIDPSLRASFLERQSLDPGVGVLLLDVVLGYGAHPDPAGELAPGIAAALERRPEGLAVVASLCGTERDPQGLEGQAERLHRAGAVVTRSNADAARLALEAAGVSS
jgi:FdrA protein